MPGKQARLVDPHLHVDEAVLNYLEATDRPAELMALAGMGKGDVNGRLGGAGDARAIPARA